MRTQPITPARIAFDAGVPRAPEFDDIYHSRAGALAQAEHVFLRGNGLPRRWADQRRFVVLETGFGLGNNFLATWAQWRSDLRRCRTLHFVSVDKHPPTRADLLRAHEGSALAEAAAQLVAAWPPLTGDLHRLVFEGGRVELLLALGEAERWLARLELQADAIFLDGFAPQRNPAMWTDAIFASLARLAAPGATAATWCAARAVREGLARHGFEVARAQGFDAKREMTVAHYAPRHAPLESARRAAACPGAQHAVVVGAGLAGAACALALADAGLQVSVLDALHEPASGSPAGLFRAVVSRDDGAHARWHRAAALEAQRQLALLIAGGLVPGAQDGVLHFGEDLAAMQRMAERQALPPEFARVLDAPSSAAQGGLAAAAPAWLFCAGGWVDPGALVRHWLASAGAERLGGRRVAALRRQGDLWQLLDSAGRTLAAAPLVVLANADQAAHFAPQALWPLRRARGQVTRVPCGTPGLLHPRLPLAGGGYVIPLPDGAVLCGATHAIDDEERALRETDHRHNLDVLARLTGFPQSGRAPADEMSVDRASLAGGVGWRCHTDDKLPLVGAVPATDLLGGGTARLQQPRHVPRLAGLYALAALGSRGITSAPLAARVLAGLVTGAPLPIDNDLLDAVDAARHVARAARRH